MAVDQKATSASWGEGGHGPYGPPWIRPWLLDTRIWLFVLTHHASWRT